MSKQQDSNETVQRISLVLIMLGVASLGTAAAWTYLGWEQPKWSERQQEEFALAARNYNHLGHRIDPKDNEPDYDEKLRVAKAEYDKQHQLLLNARARGDWTVNALFYGGMALAGLGAVGSMAVNRGE